MADITNESTEEIWKTGLKLSMEMYGIPPGKITTSLTAETALFNTGNKEREI
jgi:hypothetical protein